jgi:hypothetical protein
MFPRLIVNSAELSVSRYIYVSPQGEIYKWNFCQTAVSLSIHLFAELEDFSLYKEDDMQQEKIFLSLSLSARWCLAARENILVFILIY